MPIGCAQSLGIYHVLLRYFVQLNIHVYVFYRVVILYTYTCTCRFDHMLPRDIPNTRSVCMCEVLYNYYVILCCSLMR